MTDPNRAGAGGREPDEGAGNLPPVPAREPLDEATAEALIIQYVDRAFAEKYGAKIREARETLREARANLLEAKENSRELSESKRVLASFVTSVVSQINRTAERFLELDETLDGIERRYPDSDLAATRLEVRAENLRLVRFAATLSDAGESLRTADDDSETWVALLAEEGSDEDPPEDPAG